MFNKIIVSVYTLLIILAISDNLSAQDRLFTHTYQSNILAKGQKELEMWNTFRTGKDKSYNRIDSRAEFEVGLGKKLQTSFYTNFTTITEEKDISGIKSLETEHEFSFSNEWKYKFSDPVANPLGFALYGEYTIGTKEYEFEGKLIFDKQIKDFTLALNLTGAMGYESGIKNNEVEWEKKREMVASFGVSYPLARNFHLSIEAVNKNILADKELIGSALFAGLGFAYYIDNFWLNFTLLPQITSFKGATNNNLNLKDFEKIETRLIFSYVF
jgi:hypothetical protein